MSILDVTKNTECGRMPMPGTTQNTRNLATPPPMVAVATSPVGTCTGWFWYHGTVSSVSGELGTLCENFASLTHLTVHLS